MYEVFKNVILSGRYELSDMLKKIDTMWIQGDISEEQKTELVGLAQDYAKPENSYEPLQNQIDSLFKNLGEMANELKVVTDRVSKLEGSEVVPEPPAEEYPQYKQPSGKHDAYNKGDKITYNGKKYECIKNNVVWNPDEYPKSWQEMVEGVE